MKSTPDMRARARELATPPRDDFDRAVLAVLDDFDAALTLAGNARREAIEECAKVAETLPVYLVWTAAAEAKGERGELFPAPFGGKIAAAIRALEAKSDGEESEAKHG